MPDPVLTDMLADREERIRSLTARRDAFLRKIDAEIEAATVDANALRRVIAMAVPADAVPPTSSASGSGSGSRTPPVVAPDGSSGVKFAVDAALPHMTGEFTHNDVVKKIVELGLVTDPTESFTKVVSKTVYRIFEAGSLTLVRRGVGPKPSVYANHRGGRSMTAA